MDAELVEKAVSGDRRAFGQLVERHYDFVHAVAWRWSGNAADAEDIAQDVCVRLGTAVRGFRGTSRFRTWLYTLTLNAARDHKRRQMRDTSRIQAYANEQPVLGGGETAEDDRQEALWTAVQGAAGKTMRRSACSSMPRG